MFSKIMKKKNHASEEDKTHAQTIEKISKMNLTEMRTYVNNRIKDFEVSEVGLVGVMKKLTTLDENTKKYYLKPDDMEVKIKKAFDLVLLICKNKKINVDIVDLIAQFMKVYFEIIKKYDVDNKEIYHSRLKDTLEKIMLNMNDIMEVKRKMKLIEENDQ